MFVAVTPVAVVQLLTGVAMKTIHGMFAAKPEPMNLPLELNIQIIAVSVCCTLFIHSCLFCADK